MSSSSIDPEEVYVLLESPVTIYAPEGTRFTLRRFVNREVAAEQVGTAEPAALIHRVELRGPDDSNQLWLADSDGELVPNPADRDVPASWTERARIALRSYIDWERWAGVDLKG